MAIVAAGLAAGCDLPRDQAHSLDRIKGGQIKVGIIANPPWANAQSASTDSPAKATEPNGLEVELIREFAASLDAEPVWITGPDATIMKALEHREIDVAIGGLTDDTLWKSKLGLTQPFLDVKLLVATPPGVEPVEDVDGMEILVEDGSYLAPLVRSEGGKVAIVSDVANATKPVALADFRADALGYGPTEIELQTNRHVMAVPAGENGLLRKLDVFLEAKRKSIRDRLAKEMQL